MALPFCLDSILDTKQFLMDTGTAFRGLSVSETSEGWNVVLRAFTADGTAVYALSAVADPYEGLSRLYEALSLGNGASLWRNDRFYSNGG